MLFRIFIAIAVFFLKTDAKTLFVIDIGYQTPDVTLGQKIAVLSCQVREHPLMMSDLKGGWGV